jgi:hypothetical protein
MTKRLALALCWLAAGTVAAADLTPLELRWLKAGAPVLEDARRRGLPIDVVVQPQPAPGHAALAMDYVGGRCKLVLSMRGNAEAEAPLSGVPPALVPVVIEAVTAHEVAHCWRHVSGRWNTMPAGVAEPLPDADEATTRAWQAMRATRREEGFADLVGLAWTLERHPAQYAQVHAWFERMRAEPAVPGSHHDTRAWLHLAADAAALEGSDPFERASALWPRGMAEPH